MCSLFLARNVTLQIIKLPKTLINSCRNLKQSLKDQFLRYNSQNLYHIRKSNTNNYTV